MTDTAADAAADEIEQLAGERLDDAERQALTAVRRFTFNAAADCWPGWRAGAFEDGAEWIEQLRTALKVFAPGIMPP
jgi:hypothetical protein